LRETPVFGMRFFSECRRDDELRSELDQGDVHVVLRKGARLSGPNGSRRDDASTNLRSRTMFIAAGGSSKRATTS
jgi:hypothetical protein